MCVCVNLTNLRASMSSQSTPQYFSNLDVEARMATERRKLWQNCTRIIADLLKNGNTKLYFGEPMRGDYYPQYYDIIKEPRDLGTIKKNLDSRTHYKNIYELRDDVRLCFENCRMFNPQGHQVRNFGDAASNAFEKEWVAKNVEAEWEELQALASKAMKDLPPGPGREMTMEEKRKLSHLITRHVNAEQMGRVMEMIMEGPSAPKAEEGGDGEVEVDIDMIDKDTLWKIQAYVDTIAAAENAAKMPAGGAGGVAAQRTVTATGETGQKKKDVQIKDVKGWADLSKGAAAKNNPMLQRDDEPVDALWMEFKGKEREQQELKEQRKALEEQEARKKAAAAEDELRRRQEEVQKQQEAAAAEEKKKQEQEAELRKRQSLELDMMNKKAKADAELDLMKQAGHGGGEDYLEDLDLGDAGGESDDEEEEAMDICI